MTGEATLRPTGEAELCELIADAAARGERLSLGGGGSKSDIGRPLADARPVDLSGFTGVVDYDPPELVLTVRPGAPLADVQALVAAEGQMLAFEPFDHGPLFGRPAGAATIGGVVAAGVSGSQRLAFGAARDHLLGVRAVSGRGEMFVGGAKVVKNVTGYDLPKLIAGSWGRLAAITELTLKVLPAPRVAATRVLAGLDPAAAVEAMAAAMGSQADVACAAHLPGRTPITAFRLQGFPGSVAARCETLAQRLKAFGDLSDAGGEGAAIWTSLRTLEPLPRVAPLWRISAPPSQGAAVAATLEREGAPWLMDWAGGLVWTAFEGEASRLRETARNAGGHAQLVRASAATRSATPAFHPPAAGVAALETRVRRAFDPAGVFETGRF